MVNLRSGHWRRPWWLAFLDRTNLTVSGLTACTVLYTRSAGVAFFSAGAVMCSLTVKLLKIAIRQPRPLVQSQMSQRKSTYGMPSTHSATISFFATYIPLSCLFLPLHHSLPSGVRVFLPLIVLPWASLIVMSRVWLGHHTWPQVMVGVSYGIIFALAWFRLWRGGLDAYGRGLEQVLQSLI